MEKLSAEMGGRELRRSDEYGVPVKGKEAIAFAILANETIRLAPSNLPSATGASGYRILGKITPP
jgi:anhydro-N-acetylmuramic acid kinase